MTTRRPVRRRSRFPTLLLGSPTVSPGPWQPRSRRAAALVVAAAGAATFLSLLLAQGTSPGADQVVWAPAARNGFQSGDLPIAAVWLLAIASCAAVLARRRSAGPTAAVVAGLLLTVLALTLLKGDGPDSGATLLAFGAGMGVNVGDLPVLATWLLGTCALVLAGRRRPKPCGEDPVRPE